MAQTARMFVSAKPILAGIFPNFTLMIGSSIYGLITSELYGEIVAIIFVFFYNLWPTALFRQRIAQR